MHPPVPLKALFSAVHPTAKGGTMLIHETDDKVVFFRTCRMCKEKHEITVSREEYNAYKQGELIQYAFPKLNADDRELLISGICGKCYDRIFAD